MSYVEHARVEELLTVSGTGAITTGSTEALYMRTFASACTVGDTFPLWIVDNTTGDVEFSMGTYSAANTISRSAFGSHPIVNFAGNTCQVFIGTPPVDSRVPLEAANAVAGTQEVVPISQADGRYLQLTGGTLTGDLAIPSLNGGQLAGLRNRIINGSFDIWQRGTSFTGTGYTADRWVVISIGTGGAQTVSRQSHVLGNGISNSEYFLRVDRTTASTGLNNFLAQKIEGVQTLAGKTITISFLQKCSVAGKAFSLPVAQFFGTGGSPSADVYTGFPSFTTTTNWTRITRTITLPSVSGKTLGTNGDDSLDIYFQETANFSTFTLDISDVQVEEGSTATPFERRPIGLELALCQRYYQVIESESTSSTYFPFAISAAVSTTSGRGIIYYKVPMRAVPSITFSGTLELFGNGTSDNVTGITLAAGNELSNDGFLFDATPSNNLVLGYSYELRASNDKTAKIVMDAEL